MIASKRHLLSTLAFGAIPLGSNLAVADAAQPLPRPAGPSLSRPGDLHGPSAPRSVVQAPLAGRAPRMLLAAPSMRPSERSPSQASTVPHHRQPAKRKATVAHSRTISLHDAVAHAAGDPGVTIVNFTFSPNSTTVHVGDTITWTNNDPAPHTATAKDGSFDTGILTKGRSGSHAFTHAGTFSYYCSVHPYMHGTVVVLAAAATGQTSPSSTAATAPKAASPTATSSSPAAAASPTASQASSTPTLPATGMNVLGGAAAGLLLLAGGLTLRKARLR